MEDPGPPTRARDWTARRARFCKIGIEADGTVAAIASLMKTPRPGDVNWQFGIRRRAAYLQRYDRTTGQFRGAVRRRPALDDGGAGSLVTRGRADARSAGVAHRRRRYAIAIAFRRLAASRKSERLAGRFGGSAGGGGANRISGVSFGSIAAVRLETSSIAAEDGLRGEASIGGVRNVCCCFVLARKHSAGDAPGETSRSISRPGRKPSIV